MTPPPEQLQPVSDRPSLVRAGGAMGIAACALGLLIFLASCAGLSAAMVMSIIPLVMSAAGLTMTIIGGAIQTKQAGVSDPHVVASLFINLAGLIGALLLMTIWRGW